MKQKDLKIDFRYLTGNIACLSVDSISGESVHNDINNEEAIIIFNSLVGEKENCQTVKTLLKENQELKKQLEERTKMYLNAYKYAQGMENEVITLNTQQKEFIKWLEDNIDKLREIISDNQIENNRSHLNYLIYKRNLYTIILQKYKEIIGALDEKGN